MVVFGGDLQLHQKVNGFIVSCGHVRVNGRVEDVNCTLSIAAIVVVQLEREREGKERGGRERGVRYTITPSIKPEQVPLKLPGCPDC